MKTSTNLKGLNLAKRDIRQAYANGNNAELFYDSDNNSVFAIERVGNEYNDSLPSNIHSVYRFDSQRIALPSRAIIKELVLEYIGDLI